MNTMKIAFYCQYDKRVNDDHFLLNYPITNEYVRLTHELREDGYEVHTLDIYKKQNIHPDICIFLDIPTVNIDKFIDKNMTQSIVLLREPELVNKLNYDKKRHSEFDYILTWKSDLLDSKKYFFFPSTKFIRNAKIDVENIFVRKLCVLINSNLTSKAEGELYSQRLKIIKWFEENHNEDFDLFGYGWDEYRLKIKSKTIFKSKLLAPKRLSYKGIIDDKLVTMSKYKFAICFENTNNFSDYISEKIFDCFLARTVPIYWGAPNIETLIPKSCFIDFREFRSYIDLFDYINNITALEYTKYLKSIDDFLNSEKSYVYTLENWIAVLKKTIYKLEMRSVEKE